MQMAIIGGATLRSGSSSFDGTSSVLVSGKQSIGDVLAIAGMNCAWLAAIAMLAWPIARLWSWGLEDTWDRPAVNRAARVLYPLVALCLILILAWVFSDQALALDARLRSHWALLVTLPHGTLEFGALLLPLAAAATCIADPAEKAGRLLLNALSVSLLLLFGAALVEVYLTPHLLRPFLL